MRNLLALVGLLVVGFGAVGWYCGWYKLSINREPDGNLQIKTNVDTDKVVNDSSAFFEKVGQMVGERGEKTGPPASTPAKTPATSTKGENFDGGWLLAPSKPATVNR
jgi:hypothetical protein